MKPHTQIPRPTPSSPITIEMIQAKFQSMLARGENQGTATHHALYYVLDHFLGLAWLNNHVLFGCAHPGYLSQNPKVIDEHGFGIDKDHTQRVFQLAEALFNLQGTAGLNHVLDKLYAGQIEASMAELDFGMFMRMQGTRFHYVEETGVRGTDYDVDIFYLDGIRACGDIKCKVEGSEFSRTGLLNSLKAAKKQFPEDCPGIVFVKVPQEWVDRSTGVIGAGDDMDDLLNEFFRNTKRVVLVALYTKLTLDSPTGTAISYSCRQFENRANKFPREGTWTLFDVAAQVPVWINLTAVLRVTSD